MRYIYYLNEGEKNWIELDEEYYATRQIVYSDGVYHVSCLEDCLAEGQIAKEDLDADVIDISSQDFERVWNKSLIDYRIMWGKAKCKYKINDTITASLAFNYPQGAIFKTGNLLIKYIGNKEVKLHDRLKMKIVGYDDVNMWIIAR